MHQDRNQYMSVRSQDQIKNHSKHHDRNNEFEFKKIHQQLMRDGKATSCCGNRFTENGD